MAKLKNDPLEKSWTIRSIAPKVRTLAIKAARKEGKSLGRWLTDYILLNTNSYPPSTKELAREVKELAKEVKALNSKRQSKESKAQKNKIIFF